MFETSVIFFIVILFVNLPLYPIFISILKRYPLWVSYVFLLGVFLEGIFVILITLINVFGGYCDKQRIEFGNSLVSKIMQFQSDNGEYPKRIFDLIPNYLLDKPVYNCMESLGLEQDTFIAYYEIMVCEGNQSLVTQSTTDGRVMWYDFETGKWSRISFFNSDCH